MNVKPSDRNYVRGKDRFGRTQFTVSDGTVVVAESGHVSVYGTQQTYKVLGFEHHYAEGAAHELASLLQQAYNAGREGKVRTPQAQVQVLKRGERKWDMQVTDVATGEEIASSEGYFTKKGAREHAEKIARNHGYDVVGA